MLRIRRPLVIAWIGVCLIAVSAWPGPARAETEAGTVLALRGPCFLVSGTQKTALKMDEPVQVGDKIEVQAGAKLKLRLQDGSVVSAGSGTTLTVQAFALDRTAGRREAVLSLSEGILRAVVAKMTQPSTFEVTTASGVAAVRSTDWFVEAGHGVTRVGVLHGTVILTSVATRRPMRITARQGSHVDAGKDPVPARVWTAAQFKDVIARTDLD